MHSCCVWKWLHACEFSPVHTCQCLCLLICRRGRSGARATTSCFWPTSMPTRGNSTRQQSFINAPATNPGPWACTLTCACSSTPRWLSHRLTETRICTFGMPLYQYSRTDLENTACFRRCRTCVFLHHVQLCQVEALLCVQPAPLNRRSFISSYITGISTFIIWSVHTHHAFTHISLLKTKVTRTHWCSCEWSTNGEGQGKHLLLHAYFDEEVSWSWDKVVLYYVYMWGGHFDHQHYIHIAAATDMSMTGSCIFVCACVSDCMCVWCGCCIFMWLCGHLFLQAVCFR